MTNICSSFKFYWLFSAGVVFICDFYFDILEQSLPGFANITLQQIVAAQEENETDFK